MVLRTIDNQTAMMSDAQFASVKACETRLQAIGSACSKLKEDAVGRELVRLFRKTVISAQLCKDLNQWV